MLDTYRFIQKEMKFENFNIEEYKNVLNQMEEIAEYEATCREVIRLQNRDMELL